MYSYLDGKQTTEQNELVQKLVHDSSKIVDWLSNEDVNAELTEMSQLGGHSAKRTHRPKSGIAGKVIVDALKKRVEMFGDRVQFIYNATLSDIIIDEEKKEIQGIRYINQSQENQTIQTRALILACGGFANDHTDSSLLSEFAPSLLEVPTTNGLFASGDCIKIARKTVDAHLIDMKEIQLHPTGFIDPAQPNYTTKFLAPEALRGLGGILLNNEGKRFVNELDLRSKVVDKIYENKEKFPIYLLVNEQIANTFGSNFNFYWKVKGIFTEYNNLTDLANKTGLNQTILTETFTDYEQSKTTGHDQFGKTVFPAGFTINDKLYLSQITPVIHYTMGGLEINKKSEILNNQGQPIKGLFGAGEVTGGVHGKNRLGGNSLLDCGVYGQQAGISAANYLKEVKVEL
eukprot:TRINITY_DN383_c0_g1_i1.p1 TRINITY_DN383_c0_g1~~TRINITY_DN383_c0_g1_i1.p1  ORF type:complete len:402 (+),score=68.42 TRINITY_DN383_c0_g1_i1:505-1710(+)